MNNQEAFDTVARHLLTQKCRSEAYINNMIECAYRGDKGTKCAIGALIPDSLYDPGFEGVHITALIERRSELETLLGSIDAQLLNDLQKLHDVGEPRDWKKRLRRAAKRHQLHDAVLNSL